jgi:HAD superfamily hydrolase (TIGR01509 family)
MPSLIRQLYKNLISTEESIRRFTGLNAKTVRQIILDESGKDVPLDYLNSQQPKVLKAFEAELCALIKPTLETLEEMKICRCVASSSSKDRVIRSRELTDQYIFFTYQSVFTSQQVSKGKPAPDLFLFAASQMGFSPEDCIVIEDSAAGIEAAISAGMHVVGFLGGSHAHFNWYQERINRYNIPNF